MAKLLAGTRFAVVVLATIVGCDAETMFDVLSAAGHSPNEDAMLKAVEPYPGASNCFVTSQMPQAPRSLSFCHKFNDGACCVPQLDDENNDFFQMLTNLGLSCRIRGDIRADPLATFYCLNCDPQQPDYVRLGLSSLDDDAGTPYSENGNSGEHGGDYGVSGTTGDPVGFSSEEDKQTLLVDVAWAQSEFKTDPLLAGPDDRLSKCGLLVSVPCMGDNGEPLEGRDRYMCGDDLIIPSNPDHGCLIYNSSSSSTHDVLVNASLEQFLNLDSLGTPLLDESFYFKLVRNSFCSNEEAANYLNPHCLRTATQITTLAVEELQRNFNVAMTYRDWVCANTGDAGWVPTVADNNFCSAVTCDGDAAAVAQAKLDNPCCCVPWKNEMAFNSASTVQPAFAMVLALIAIFLVY